HRFRDWVSRQTRENGSTAAPRPRSQTPYSASHTLGEPSLTALSQLHGSSLGLHTGCSTAARMLEAFSVYFTFMPGCGRTHEGTAAGAANFIASRHTRAAVECPAPLLAPQNSSSTATCATRTCFTVCA